MLHPLKKQVRAVRRRAFRLVLVHGLTWWAALTLIVAFLAGLADYLIRFQDEAARALTFAAVVTFLAVAFWRLVLPGLRQPVSDLQVAQLIERRFPQLQDRLSSSLAFLGEPAGRPAMGSPALQASVIAETDRLVATLNIFDCLDRHDARRALGVLAIVVATTSAVCALDLPAAWMASQRLLLPWSDAAWPRRNQLEFVNPPRLLARGDDFEVALIDRHGHLPATATLEIKFAEDRQPQTREIYRADGRMVARLENVTDGFQFRAVGGDDHTMAWHELEIREPVRITNVEISVQPPEYTGLPLANSNRLIRAWAGSAVRVKAVLSAPAELVTIKSNFADAPDIQLASDGRSFQLPAAASPPWIPAEPGNFHFRIKDRGGLEVTSDLSFELTLVEDAPPTVSLEAPTENESFLPGAEVPVRAVIQDDLAVRSATLLYHDQTWPLFELPAAAERGSPIAPGPEDQRRLVDTVWPLAALPLEPGDIVEFMVVAEDGKPQTGSSGVRHLTIISAEDFDRRLDQDQAEFRRRIEESLKLQLRVQTHTDMLAKSTDWSVDTPGTESMQSALWGQLQIRQMVSGTDGALLLAEQLLQRLANNHADKPDVAARLTTVVRQLRGLDAVTLPGIEHQLGSALKISQTGGPTPTANERSQSQAAVSQARQGQQEAVAVLETILQQFAKWTNVRRIATDVAGMQQQQQQLMDDTRALNTVGKALRDLTAEEAELLRQLVQRQAQLARRADRLLLELEQLRQKAASEDPAFSEMIRRAFDPAEQADVAAAAHEARRNLEENQLGSAASRQGEVQAALRSILNAISRRAPDSAGALTASVQDWLARQQSLLTSTGKLDLQPEDPASAPQRQRSARSLAVPQAALADEVAAAATPQAGPVVQFILDDASRRMTAAADALAKAETGPTTQGFQQAAQAQLMRLAEALRTASRDPGSAPENGGDPTGQQPGPQGTDQRIGIADLRLLRQLQLEIYQQTFNLEQARNDQGSLRPQQHEELAELEGRQKRLVELVSSLLGEEPARDTSAKPKAGSDLDDALRKANIPGFSED